VISIVLATYNEAATVQPLIVDLLKHCPAGEDMEIIVVDDNSPDGTAALARGLQDERVIVIQRTAIRGLAAAFNRGVIESRGDYVGWMDADMCMPAAMIPKMYAKIRNDGWDIVIGSRYAAGGKDERTTTRVVSSRIINGLATLVLGYGIKDYNSGFVLMKRSALDAATVIPTGYGEYFIEFIYNACRAGLRVTEVGYRFVDRADGQSKSAPNVATFVKHGVDYTCRIFRARFR
jgi:dolichol-phosphate mannosyltransferase